MKNIHNISPEELERIERFLNQDMDEAEEKAFANMLNADSFLREKTEEIKLLLLGVKEAALQEKLQDFHKEIKPAVHGKSATPVLSMKRLLVAASLLIVAATSLWWFLYNESGNKKLYNKYYSPDPGLATVMSSSGSYDFEKAMVGYKNGEYDKALEAWQSLLSQQPGNDTLIYFIGAASQAMEKEDQAIDNLQKIAVNTGSVFYQDACWYLGLCYLKKGEKKLAVEYIERSGYPEAPDIIKAIHKK